MITNLEITLTDGTKYKMNMPETIKDIDDGKKALFMFDNCDLYSGYSDGLVDEEGDFAILKTPKGPGIAMPFDRLVGWAYKKGGTE